MQDVSERGTDQQQLKTAQLADRAGYHFGMSRRELVLAVVFLVLLGLLKLTMLGTVAADSDESQHAHVIWAWARGFVQYRDLFDNHMPLFQIMFAPVYGVIGDRPNVLIWLRLAMLPLQLLIFWAVYRIASALFSARVALWTIILVGFYSRYFYGSLEFRTDVLWAACWLMAIAELLSGTIDWRRALRAGLLVGLAFAVSLKTALLLSSMIAAALVMLLYREAAIDKASRWQKVRKIAAFTVPIVLIPGIIGSAFYLAGAWREFFYCAVQFNTGAPRHHKFWFGVAQFAVAFAFSIYIGSLLLRWTRDRRQATQRAFLIVCALCYISALHSFWPLVTREDYLPVYPALAVFLAAGAVGLSEWLEAHAAGGKYVSVPGLATILQLFICVHAHPFWRPGMREERRLLRQVQRLTRPGDFVLDAKGETIFRQRCIWAVLEGITLRKIRRGSLSVDVEARCKETHTCVVAENSRYQHLPKKTREFIRQTYPLLAHGRIGVAGGLMQQAADKWTFYVVIPAEYTFIANGRTVGGSIDDQPYQKSRYITAGKHTFAPWSTAATVQFTWARAAEAGLIPPIALEEK